MALHRRFVRNALAAALALGAHQAAAFEVTREFSGLWLDRNIKNAELVRSESLDSSFDVFVRDVSRFAVQLHGKPSSTQAQQDLCLAMIAKPVVDAERYEQVWREHVLALADAYEMNP